MKVRAVALDARQKFKISLFTIFFAENPLQGKKRERTQMKTHTNENLVDKTFFEFADRLVATIMAIGNKHADDEVRLTRTAMENRIVSR